jgi:lysylphosphatidylglycerol synthetase-like protein (DUF2156 family)
MKRTAQVEKAMPSLPPRSRQEPTVVETPAPRGRSLPSLPVTLAGFYLFMGLLYQLLYFGFQSPLRFITWFHICAWPLYVILGMLRAFFYPVAMIALIGIVLALVYDRFRRPAR